MARKPFKTPTFHTAEVNGEERHFYAASYGTSMKLKELAKPVVAAIATLLSDNPSDVGLIKNEVLTETSELETNTAYQPIAPELARLRSQERGEAFNKLCDALFLEGNRVVLCELIVDSLQEEFPERKKGMVRGEDIEWLQENCDLPTFMAMLKGVAFANANTFGPLAQRLTLAAKKFQAPGQPTSESAEASQQSQLTPG